VRPISRPAALLAGALGAGVALGYLFCCLLGALFGQPPPGGI
jgi:hypothetical protein